MTTTNNSTNHQITKKKSRTVSRIQQCWTWMWFLSSFSGVLLLRPCSNTAARVLLPTAHSFLLRTATRTTKRTTATTAPHGGSHHSTLPVVESILSSSKSWKNHNNRKNNNNQAAFQSGTTTTTTTTTAATTTTRLYNTNENDESKPEQRQRRRRRPWNFFRFVQQSSKFVPLPPLFSPLSSMLVPSSSEEQQQSKTTERQSPPPPIQPGQILWQPQGAINAAGPGGETKSGIVPSSSESSYFQWAPLDDVVMGGVSHSTFDNYNGVWRGTVTDDNNGGFVGIRSCQPLDLHWDLQTNNCRGLQFTLAAADTAKDQQQAYFLPRRIKIVLRDAVDFNGIAWTTAVDVVNKNDEASNSSIDNKKINRTGKQSRTTESDGMTADSSASTTTQQQQQQQQQQQYILRIPLHDDNDRASSSRMIPTRFGQTVSTSKQLNTQQITAVQMVYSKFEFDGQLNPTFQQGDFALQLLRVEAY